MSAARSVQRRYCEPCDRWVSAREYECRLCGADTTKAETPARKLTTHERHQAAADAGIDTWAEYPGER